MSGPMFVPNLKLEEEYMPTYIGFNKSKNDCSQILGNYKLQGIDKELLTFEDNSSTAVQNTLLEPTRLSEEDLARFMKLTSTESRKDIVDFATVISLVVWAMLFGTLVMFSIGPSPDGAGGGAPLPPPG